MSDQEPGPDGHSPDRGRKAVSGRKSKKSKAARQTKSKDGTLSYLKLVRKIDTLLDLIQQSSYIVVYSSDGVSKAGWRRYHRHTDGSCPRVKQIRREEMTTLLHLSLVQPTYTHLAIRELAKRGVVKHIRNVDVDALYVRSGVKQGQLSEVFGNTFIKVCGHCHQQYYMDNGTLNKSARCLACSGQYNAVEPTMSHPFSDEDRPEKPWNWPGARAALARADLIIGIGSDLEQVIHDDRMWSSKARLVIINHEPTLPMDKERAVLTIKGKYDRIMKEVMQRLNIEVPAYDWKQDPIVAMAAKFQARDEDPNELMILDLDAVPTPQQVTSLAADFSYKSPDHNPEQSSNDSNYDKSNNPPSLFVSELTDDPAGKHLKMRIRLNSK